MDVTGVSRNTDMGRGRGVGVAEVVIVWKGVRTGVTRLMRPMFL